MLLLTAVSCSCRSLHAMMRAKAQLVGCNCWVDLMKLTNRLWPRLQLHKGAMCVYVRSRTCCLWNRQLNAVVGIAHRVWQTSS